MACYVPFFLASSNCPEQPFSSERLSYCIPGIFKITCRWSCSDLLSQWTLFKHRNVCSIQPLQHVPVGTLLVFDAQLEGSILLLLPHFLATVLQFLFGVQKTETSMIFSQYVPHWYFFKKLYFKIIFSLGKMAFWIYSRDESLETQWIWIFERLPLWTVLSSYVTEWRIICLFKSIENWSFQSWKSIPGSGDGPEVKSYNEQLRELGKLV